MVDMFAPCGLTVERYFAAVLPCPRLLGSNPETIAPRLRFILKMHRKGLFAEGKGGGVSDEIFKSPEALGWGFHNLRLDQWRAMRFGVASRAKPAYSTVMMLRKNALEAEYATAFPNNRRARG